MKLARLLPIVLFASLGFGATVSGKLSNPDTSGAIPGFIQFDLENCGLNYPIVSGFSITPQQKFNLASDGTWTGTLDRNDQIGCNGDTSSNWWHVTYFVNFRQVGPARDVRLTSVNCASSCVVDGITPLVVFPTIPTGTGDNTYLRLDGGNQPNPYVFTQGLSVNGPFISAGTGLFTGLDSFANINQTVYADQCSGADAGAKIATCIGLLPSTGGIVNATAFQGAQSFTPVTVTKNGVRILFGAATFTCSGRCFAVNANNFELAGQGDASDFVMANATNVDSIDLATDGASHSGIYIHDLQLDGNAANQTLATYGISANTASGSITNFRFENNFLHDHKRASNAGNEILVNVSGSSRGIIQLNRCLNHACVVVFGNDMTVSNNVATNADDDAFAAVGGAGLPVSRITFVGNTVNGTTHGAGIDVVNGRNVTISANTIISANGNGIIAWDNGLGFANSTQDSTISGNSVISSGSNGINVIGTRDTITGNTVKFSGNNGIYVPTPATILNITGNMTMDNGLLAAVNQSNGITIDGATSILANANTASDDQVSHTQVSGIQAQSGPSSVYLLNNVMANNTTNGYAFLSGTSNLASGNIVNGVRQFDDRIQNTPTFSSTTAFFPLSPAPGTAGASDAGTTALPWGNLWLGTAATNNFKFQPAATTGARIITIADPLSPTTVGMPLTIGSGTASMTTAGILTGACGTTVTVGATGVLTTDVINVTRNGAANIGNGGGLTLNAWPTAGNVNLNYCNSSAGTITPTAMTVNWQVTR